MVAPSDKKQTKIAVKCFAREEATMTPDKCARHARDMAAADAWSNTSEAVAERFRLLARRNMTSTWYAALSSDEAEHWLTYFRDDVSGDGLLARRIPAEATRALALAGKRDSFTQCLIRANRERRQYVLMGVLPDDDGANRYYPIIAWHPTTGPIPDAKELAAYYAEAQEKSATEREVQEAEEARRKKKAEDDKLRHELVLYHRSVYWRIQALVGVAVTMGATFATEQWQTCLAVLPSLLLLISFGVVSVITLTERQSKSASRAVDVILRKKRRIASVVATGGSLAVAGLVVMLL